MGQLTHTKERPVRTASKIQKSPTGCAENPQMTSKYIPVSAGAAFIWLQRGYALVFFFRGVGRVLFQKRMRPTSL